MNLVCIFATRSVIKLTSSNNETLFSPVSRTFPSQASIHMVRHYLWLYRWPLFMCLPFIFRKLTRSLCSLKNNFAKRLASEPDSRRFRFDKCSLTVLNLIPAPSPLKFIGNRKFAMGQFAGLSFISSHPTFDPSTLSHKPPRSYDFMSTQKFTFSVWPSLQISWTVCMIHFCFGWTFSMWKHLPTVSSLWHSMRVLYLPYFQAFAFVPPCGAFFFNVLIPPCSRIKTVSSCFASSCAAWNFGGWKKIESSSSFFVTFCAVRLKWNIPTFWTTGN